MNTIVVVFLTALFTLLPFAYANKNKEKISSIEVLCFGILGMAITLLIAKINNKDFNYLGIIITGLICSTFNYYATTKNVDIKMVPKSLIVLLLFFFSSLFQLILIPILHYDINNLTANENLILTAFSDFILLIILSIIYFKSLKNDFKDLKGNLYKYMDIAVKYWLIGLVVMMISNVTIGIMTSAEAVNEETVQELIHSSKYLSIITIGVMAPIIEELTFRKAFRDIFKNDLIFILTSGLVFGALHVVLSFNSLWDLLYIIPYSSLGIAFAATYSKTKNIYTTIFMHVFHNTVLTIFSILAGIGVILL